VLVPQFMQCVNPLLTALRKLGGAARPQPVFQSIARELALSSDMLSERLSSGFSTPRTLWLSAFWNTPRAANVIKVKQVWTGLCKFCEPTVTK
jgi:hypothetical protein